MANSEVTPMRPSLPLRSKRSTTRCSVIVEAMNLRAAGGDAIARQHHVRGVLGHEQIGPALADGIGQRWRKLDQHVSGAARIADQGGELWGVRHGPMSPAAAFDGCL